LTSIKVSEGNKKYDSRDNCNAIIDTEANKLVVGCATTVIPDSVTEIGGDAFNGRKSLTSIVIPDSVTKIGMDAFNGCTDLKSIVIPDLVTKIGSCAFTGCSSLTRIIVSEGNKTYDSRNNCNAIIETETNRLIAGCANTIIPDSVTEIGNNAFVNLVSLTSIVIPKSVTKIGRGSFEGCMGLTSIEVSEGNKTYDSRDNCNAIIETETKTIETEANNLIIGCAATVIPNSVTKIGKDAFIGCTGLKSIVIPDSVTKIGDGAFRSLYGPDEYCYPRLSDGDWEGCLRWLHGFNERSY